MKIIVADDHALFRDALAQYIERSDPNVTVILSQDFHGVVDAILSDPDVDLVMLDLRMPGMNGLQGLQSLKKMYPAIPVILLSGLAENKDVEDAIKLGASGYFPKTLPGKVMLQGIYKIIQGDVFIPLDHNTNDLMPSHFSDTTSFQKNDSWGAPSGGSKKDLHLTPREKEVLGYLSRGVSNKEIAQALNLQVVTIKLHVRGVCKKLGVKNRTQAALKAQQNNIISY